MAAEGARAGKSKLHVCVAVEIGPRRVPRLTLQGQLALDMGLKAGSKHCRDVGRIKAQRLTPVSHPADLIPEAKLTLTEQLRVRSAVQNLVDGASIRPHTYTIKTQVTRDGA